MFARLFSSYFGSGETFGVITELHFVAVIKDNNVKFTKMKNQKCIFLERQLVVTSLKELVKKDKIIFFQNIVRSHNGTASC